MALPSALHKAKGMVNDIMKWATLQFIKAKPGQFETRSIHVDAVLLLIEDKESTACVLANGIQEVQPTNGF